MLAERGLADMTKRKYIAVWASYLLLLIVATIAGVVFGNRSNIFTLISGAVQMPIYLGLLTVWVFSVHQRVLKAQTKRLLEAVGGLLMLWFLLRGIKYYLLPIFGNPEDIKRYFWYGYYIPMLLLPALLVLISCSLRQPDGYLLPKRVSAILFAVSILFILTVATNDLHQLVFKFPDGAAVFKDSDYTYGFLYYVLAAWIVGCALASFVIMLKKSRLRNEKIVWMPLLPLLICVIYGILYININGRYIIMDFTRMYCFLLLAILELMIYVGLIPSNTHYKELFAASDLPVLITDTDLLHRSYSRAPLKSDTEVLREATESGAVTRDGMRVSAYPINGGYVFWQDDMTELYEITEELGELDGELKDQYMVAQEEYRTSRRRQSLAEKNRLYNIMQNETEERVNKLDGLIAKLDAATDKGEICRLTSEISVLCAYLKRRNNLLFIKEGSGDISGKELTYCIKESLALYSLCVGSVNLNSDLSRAMPFDMITKLYDAFEYALEASLDSTSELFVTLTENECGAVLRMNFVCTSDLSRLADLGFTVEDEGGEWALEYTVREGGGDR